MTKPSLLPIQPPQKAGPHSSKFSIYNVISRRYAAL
jgi:hypothetical protein